MTAMEMQSNTSQLALSFIQALFMHFPRQRRLSNDVKEEASQLISMKANKKLIQQKLSQKTGQIILLKDLTNISTMIQSGKSRNNIDTVVRTLVEKHGKGLMNVHS